jgi:hypothetical protein
VDVLDVVDDGVVVVVVVGEHTLMLTVLPLWT